jgi:hypothetical protein
MRRTIGLAVLLGACTTVPLAERGSTRTFVGVVRVTMPDRSGDLAAVAVTGVGAGWDGGPWLGFRAGEWVTADPSRCQLLVVIRSPAQAANAAQVLATLKGDKICVADFTRSVRR